MAFDTDNGTKLASLIDPEVLAAMVDKKLVDAIKFAPLSTVDTTLAGTPGSTITVPVWTYIGDAVEIGEAGTIVPKKLTADKDTATIKKVGTGVQLTDEAVLSGYGDPVGEAVKQIALSIASAVDNDMLAVMGNATQRIDYTSPESAPATVNAALMEFGEDVEGEKVLICSPEDAVYIREAKEWLPASEIAAKIMTTGTIGEIHGCQVVISNKLKGKNEMYIVKPGALRTYLKRDTLVESDRDIYQKYTGITADKHFVNYIYDQSKIVKIGAAVASGEAAG